MSQLNAVFHEITGVTAQIRHSMEQAEAKVEDLNRLLPQLVSTGLLTRSVWLGAHVEREYDNEHGPADSGQVVQAALLLPEGFGVCLWDMEEFTRLSRSPEGLEPTARKRFQPFSQCSPTEKAVVDTAIQPLVEELADVARVAQSRLDDGENVTMDEFFAEEETDGERGK